jgi:hypothetical protein
MEKIWIVEFHDKFDPEFDDLAEGVRDELLPQLKLLEKIGPTLGRPRVDTLKGSEHANMKELRFAADEGANGAWPSLLIPAAPRLFWWPVTSQVGAKSVFTSS